MKILELFSGLGDISKAFAANGHEVYRVDWSEKCRAELHADVSKLTSDDIIELCGGVPDVIWASPDCTTYSIATHRHRTMDNGGIPKTQAAWQSDLTNVSMWHLIDELVRQGTKYYFVENPRGRMRHMPFVEGRDRHTTSYCMYGRTDNGKATMKPTDIWTNLDTALFKMCERSHEHSKQNSDVGRDYLSRGAIPPLLCQHIVTLVEGAV